MKVRGVIVVTLTPALAWALASHFKVTCFMSKFLCVNGKALVGELSCKETDLVKHVFTPVKKPVAVLFFHICSKAYGHLKVTTQCTLRHYLFSHYT